MPASAGRRAWLRQAPRGLCPQRSLNEFALELPGGGRIAANGRIGLARVTVDLSAKTQTIDHAFHGDQVKQPGAATALHAFNLPKGTQITVNGKALADLRTLDADGRPATVIPLAPKTTP